MLHVWQSRYTGGRSPSTVGLALLDWARPRNQLAISDRGAGRHCIRAVVTAGAHGDGS
ncbi:MAG: poly-beta-hydroxybutyrate polymerase N-terminal domain-containing protein [Bradyrhizobium sp.]